MTQLGLQLTHINAQNVHQLHSHKIRRSSAQNFNFKLKFWLNKSFQSHQIYCCRTTSLYIFTDIFPGKPGFAGYTGAWDDEMVMTTEAMTCKAPVKSSTPTDQHPTFYRPDLLPITQPSFTVQQEKLLNNMCL